MFRIISIIIVVLTLTSGCSSTLNSFLYFSFKSNIPNTEISHIASSQQVLWQFNSAYDTELDITVYEWQNLHQGGFDGWNWFIVAREQYELSEQEKTEWDNLFARFAQVTSRLLPNSSGVQMTLYLEKGKQQKVTLSTELNPNDLVVPHFHWSSESGASILPIQFSDRIDLLADLGSNIQQAYYLNHELPQPDDPEAAQLKKHANSACWRLAVRPALARGTKEVLKTPPSVFLSLGDTVKGIYQSNPTEIEAQTLYATVLLIKAADRYMAEKDLTWPARGDDEEEIEALITFCESYLKQTQDPRL